MKFLRRNTKKYSKIGMRRKKKQIWRRPSGRDNKIREKRRGYSASVNIGYKKDKKEKEMIIAINNLKDLEKAGKGRIVLGKIGKKKRIEIANKAKEKKIEISNLNIKKFLDKNKLKEKKNEKSK